MSKVKKNFLPIVLSVLLSSLIIFAYQQFLADKFYPLTYAGDTDISFLTQSQAVIKLQSNFEARTQQKLSFGYPDNSFALDLTTSSATLDYSALDTAFENQRYVSFFRHLKKEIIYPEITLSVDKTLSNMASTVNKSPQDAQLIFDETPESESTSSARIQIKEAQNGLALDKEKTEDIIRNFLLTGKYESQLPLQVVAPKISTNQMLKAKDVLDKSSSDPIKLSFNEKNWTIDTKQLLMLLDLTSGKGELLSRDKTLVYLGNIASEIDQEVQEGLFEFNPQTRRVTAFRPSHEGRKLNTDKTYEFIVDALNNEQARNIALPVEIIKPKIETSDVNSLGIKELLGRGISNFAGSIPNRIYNIGLTAAKINGILVPPGQNFSFNQTVGDITAATGFKQAYVIKEGRTVLDDGGGVCQDSTTLFRAVLNSGLPVIKRTAHAYRVGYYEQGFPPGLDATVFYPSVDFQFKNDTPAHILIQAYTDGTTLYVDLYGTPDGRTVTLSQSVVSNQTPPPPELRQDDPTLPKGTVKQVDWSAWGASVAFKRTVTRGGETLIDETWKSNYKPWQAVYLVGTKE